MFDELNINRAIVRRLKQAARHFAGIVIAVGIVVLLGWLFDREALRSFWMGLKPMNPVTAVSFLLCGGSVLVFSNPAATATQKLSARCAALLVAAYGASRLVLYAMHVEWGPDLLLFTSRLGGHRLSLQTALNF